MKIFFFILLFAVSAVAADTRKTEEIGKDVMRIAGALRSYAKDHAGELPESLHQLVPKYIKTSTELQIPLTNRPSSPQDYSILLFSSSGFKAGEGQSLIALMSDRVSVDGRYVVDTKFEVWWIGEARLRELLIGPPKTK